jgi:hypothetical protein
MSEQRTTPPAEPIDAVAEGINLRLGGLVAAAQERELTPQEMRGAVALLRELEAELAAAQGASNEDADAELEASAAAQLVAGVEMETGAAQPPQPTETGGMRHAQ